MLEELRHDYVRTARARRGLHLCCPGRMRCAMLLLPIVAVGGLQAGTLIAYTLLTETVFQWPGMGFFEAVTRADIPLITTYLACRVAVRRRNTLVDLASLARSTCASSGRGTMTRARARPRLARRARSPGLVRLVPFRRGRDLRRHRATGLRRR